MPTYFNDTFQLFSFWKPDRKYPDLLVTTSSFVCPEEYWIEKKTAQNTELCTGGSSSHYKKFGLHYT